MNSTTSTPKTPSGFLASAGKVSDSSPMSQSFPLRKACGRLLCLLDEDITLPLTSEYKCDLPSATVLDTSARCSKSESWLSRSEALPREGLSLF